MAASALLACGLQYAGKRLIASLPAEGPASTSLRSAQTASPTAQSEAEKLLARMAAGDSVAAEQVLAQSESWIGKTRRTPRANQLITVALERRDLAFLVERGIGEWHTHLQADDPAGGAKVAHAKRDGRPGRLLQESK